MPISFCIRLNPAELANPDLDLRYSIPDQIEEVSGGKVQSDGYDYDPKTNIMLIFLKADSEAELKQIIHVLETSKLAGNDLARAASVSIRSESGEERVVYAGKPAEE